MKTVKFIAATTAALSMMAASAQAQTFDSRNLIGAGIGAGIGGVIGSQVSGNGARTEGSAIGAVVGGLAGYGIANATRPNYGPAYGNGYSSGYGNSYGNSYGSGYSYGGGSSYGYSNRYGSAPTQYGTFGGTDIGGISAPIAAPTQYIPGGYVSGGSYTVPSSYSYTYQPKPQIVQHKIRTIRHNPVRQVQVYQAPLKHYSSSCSPCAAPKQVIYHAPKPQPVQMNSTLVSQSCNGACPSVSTSYQGKINIDPAALRNAPLLPEPHHNSGLYCKSGCR